MAIMFPVGLFIQAAIIFGLLVEFAGWEDHLTHQSRLSRLFGRILLSAAFLALAFLSYQGLTYYPSNDPFRIPQLVWRLWPAGVVVGGFLFLTVAPFPSSVRKQRVSGPNTTDLVFLTLGIVLLYAGIIGAITDPDLWDKLSWFFSRR